MIVLPSQWSGIAFHFSYKRILNEETGGGGGRGGDGWMASPT